MFIFSKVLSFIFFLIKFGPKFSELSEIWYRGELLYGYYDCNVYFFKILFIIFFWANLVQKSEVLQIDLNLVQEYLATSLLALVSKRIFTRMGSITGVFCECFKTAVT